MRIALILMMMAGTCWGGPNYVVYPTPNGKPKYTNTGDFEAMAVGTPSVTAKQKLSSAAYTWPEIKSYAVAGVTMTSLLDLGDAPKITVTWRL